MNLTIKQLKQILFEIDDEEITVKELRQKLNEINDVLYEKEFSDIYDLTNSIKKNLDKKCSNFESKINKEQI